MTYIIAEPCIGTKDAACVEVCPVDCIPLNPDYQETREQLLEKYQRITGEIAGQ